MNEENIKNQIVAKFGFLENSIKVVRQRRISLEVKKENFFEVLIYLKDELGFCVLCGITGLDDTQNFGFIYHIGNEEGAVINLKYTIPRNEPLIQTVTKYYASADIYEREIVDLLGVKVEGLKEGKRYPLPDNWPEGQFPLRKDWNPEVLHKKEKDNA